MNWFTSFKEQLQEKLVSKKQLKSRLKLLNKPKRSQLAFKKLYPRHNMGVNCYGLPKVKNALPNATLTIGSYCSIAKNVQIYLGGNHRLDWITTFPFPAFFKDADHIIDFETTKGNVIIGSDVWLGDNSTILSGISIGHGAVIANGAVVTKDVSPYEIVGGNPAKHIRWGFDDTTRNALLQSKWWDWSEEELLSIVDIICSDKICAFIDYVNEKSQTLNEFKI